MYLIINTFKFFKHEIIEAKQHIHTKHMIFAVIIDIVLEKYSQYNLPKIMEIIGTSFEIKKMKK